MSVRLTTRREVLAGMVALICVSLSVRAADVTLEWDPTKTYTDGQPVKDLSGYRLYHGKVSGDYTEHIDVTNSTVVTYTNLQSGCSNYFAVTAVDRSGAESSYSEEIALYAPPAIVLNTNALVVAEGVSGTFQVRLNAQPMNMTTVLVSRIQGGDPYLGAVGGTVLVVSPSNWSSNQTVTVTALYDPEKTNRTALFQLSGVGLSSATLSVSSTGAAQSATEIKDGYDADSNGIPDVWEIKRFGGLGMQGTAAGDDTDRDGISNAQEFIAGTDPTDSASRPLIDIDTKDGRLKVSFHAVEAVGSGYLGKTRFYTLEQCTNLLDGVWFGVDSATEIPAHNQSFTHSEVPMATGPSFYRLKISLM